MASVGSQRREATCQCGLTRLWMACQHHYQNGKVTAKAPVAVTAGAPGSCVPWSMTMLRLHCPHPMNQTQFPTCKYGLLITLNPGFGCQEKKRTPKVLGLLKEVTELSRGMCGQVHAAGVSWHLQSWTQRTRGFMWIPESGSSVFRTPQLSYYAMPLMLTT